MRTHSTLVVRVALGLSLPLVLAACSGDDFQPKSTPPDTTFAGVVLGDLEPGRLDSPTRIQNFAGAASAPNVFAISMLALSIAELSQDDACPKKTQGTNTVEYEGGCTDKNGTEWFGSVTIEGSETSSEVSYNAFGQKHPVDCKGVIKETRVTFTGAAHYEPEAGAIAFEVDLRGEVGGVVEGTCNPALGGVAWDYQGTFSQSGPDADADGDQDDTLWNGKGRFGSTADGVVEASTDNELISSAGCASEAMSGTTRLVAGPDTVVITYDGKTDCDPAGTVHYSLNGVDKGEIEGVKCSVAPGSRTPVGALGALLGALGAILARRRRWL